MMHLNHNKPLPCGLVLAMAFWSGCSRQTNESDSAWTPPVKVTDSIDNLVGGVALYKYLDTIVALQSPVTCYLMDGNSGGYRITKQSAASSVTSKPPPLPSVSRSIATASPISFSTASRIGRAPSFG